MGQTGDEENAPPQHNQLGRSATAALTLVKAGSAVVANGSGHAVTFEKVVVYNDNKENAPTARITRSRVASNSCGLGQSAAMSSGGGVGGAPSCQPTATGLANTQLHQKPRRVLQEIKV